MNRKILSFAFLSVMGYIVARGFREFGTVTETFYDGYTKEYFVISLNVFGVALYFIGMTLLMYQLIKNYVRR